MVGAAVAATVVGGNVVEVVVVVDVVDVVEDRDDRGLSRDHPVSRVRAGAANGSPTNAAPCCCPTAISFGFSCAVARLAPAKATNVMTSAVAIASTRRPDSDPVRCSRRHARRIARCRTGVSTNRYDSSATTTVATIAAANWGNVRALPATRRIPWKIGQW